MPSRTRSRQPKRSAVPAEFRSGGRSRSQVPVQTATQPQGLPEGWEPFKVRGYITQPQWNYICGMLDKRELTASDTFREKVANMSADELAKYIAELKELLKRTSQPMASQLIETLKALPYKQKAEGVGKNEPVQKVPDVPAGRYALLYPQDDLNPVRFYLVRDGKDNTDKGGKNWTGAKFVERFASDESFSVKYRSNEYFRVLKEIEANPLEAAQRFGDEWECCSQCGRGLTRRLSRKLRIGPVCLSRAGWIPDTAAYVQQARDEIIAEGHDPDEKLPQTKRRPRRRAW